MLGGSWLPLKLYLPGDEWLLLDRMFDVWHLIGVAEMELGKSEPARGREILNAYIN